MTAVHHHPAAAPAWFSNVVIECVQLLVVLALPGTPPAETITATALAWVDALWHAGPRWCADTDERRLRAAVRTIAGQADRWPAPRALLAHMPPRPPVAQLPAPAPNPQRAAAARHQLRQLAASLRVRPAPAGYDAQAIFTRLQQDDQP